MVDALRDSHRVLVPEGTLLDLRPTAETQPLEATLPDRVVIVGELEAQSPRADDDAADAAVHDAVGAGWFIPSAARQFRVAFYWDSVADLAAYAAGGRYPKHVRPGWADLERAWRELRPSRLGCKRSLSLGAYRRSSPQ
jgi:hypothetical protein